jgi:hypothetical protein
MKFPATFLVMAIAGALACAGATTGARADGIPVLSEKEKRDMIGDTAQLKGTVAYVNKANRLLVIGKTSGDETLYYGDKTEFPPTARDRVLREGAKIRAWYVTVGRRKVASRIELQ